MHILEGKDLKMTKKDEGGVGGMLGSLGDSGAVDPMVQVSFPSDILGRSSWADKNDSVQTFIDIAHI